MTQKLPYITPAFNYNSSIKFAKNIKNIPKSPEDFGKCKTFLKAEFSEQDKAWKVSCYYINKANQNWKKLEIPTKNLEESQIKQAFKQWAYLNKERGDHKPGTIITTLPNNDHNIEKYRLISEIGKIKIIHPTPLEQDPTNP